MHGIKYVFDSLQYSIRYMRGWTDIVPVGNYVTFIKKRVDLETEVEKV